MTDQISPDGGRLEQILKSVDYFKPVSTRRSFMQKLLLAGGGAAVGGALVGRVPAVLASTDFGTAAVGAERIGIAFYSNALGTPTEFGVSADQAKGTLLNDAHRVYFNAARNQETSHLAKLQRLGFDFSVSKFSFPAGTFDSASNMLAFGEKLEDIFIGAYLGAVNTNFAAELAAQIMGIECEHRVLIRDIAGLNPPNDRFYEGDATPGSSAELGNTGTRSVVYASGDDAVNALLALEIKPVA